MAMLGGMTSSSRAASATADYITNAFNLSYEHLLQSHTFGFMTLNVLEGLEKLQQDCTKQGWDGYNAIPVSPATIELAKSIIAVFPYNMYCPEISAEPDGHVSFEWYRSPLRVLSISITQDGDIHYAALIGSAKAYGTEQFKGTFPHVILDIIQRIFAL
jgi:hypothetical protein